jgi:hypothetical protein
MHSIEKASEKVEDLLAAADYFQMDGLKEMCGRLMANNINIKNCLQVSLKRDCLTRWIWLLMA